MYRYSSIAFSLQKDVLALGFHTVTAQIWHFLKKGIWVRCLAIWARENSKITGEVLAVQPFLSSLEPPMKCAHYNVIIVKDGAKRLGEQ